MRYRVDYMVDDERRTAQVEANSPQEAITKFRHTVSDRQERGGECSEVLSVLPEPETGELTW